MRRPLVVIGSAAAAAAFCVWLAYDWTRVRRAGPAAPARQGSDVIAGARDEGSLESSLARIGWADIPATLQGTNTDPAVRWRLIEAASRSSRPEVCYLRGLLLLALERREEALAAFLAIDPALIPPVESYAPYRLHGALRPGTANPFEATLQRARASGQLSPIVDARMAAEAGDLRSALQSYLRTDPAQWATRDVEVFRLLRLHAGLSPDAGSMIAAALRAGRVRADLRPAILRLLAPALSEATLAGQRQALAELVRRDPAARAVAVRAADVQLRARQQFLEGRYSDLLREYRDNDPVSVPDGTLLILLLSADEVGDAASFDAWAQELRRRFPQEDVRTWLQELRAPGR